MERHTVFMPGTSKPIHLLDLRKVSTIATLLDQHVFTIFRMLSLYPQVSVAIIPCQRSLSL